MANGEHNPFSDGLGRLDNRMVDLLKLSNFQINNILWGESSGLANIHYFGIAKRSLIEALNVNNFVNNTWDYSTRSVLVK